jgi:hypothetical protein
MREFNEPNRATIKDVVDAFEKAKNAENTLQRYSVPLQIYDEGTDTFYTVHEVEYHAGTIRLRIDSTLKPFIVNATIVTTSYESVMVWANKQSQAEQAVRYGGAIELNGNQEITEIEVTEED